MSGLRNLLVATDLSAPARHAVARAAMLASKTGARLELVHAIEKGALGELRRLFGERGDEVRERILAEARDSLSKLAAEVCAPLGIGAEHRLLEGKVLEAIAARAQALDASLLVVGARGAGFVRHWLLGATAERLLRKTLRPILVVRQAPRDQYRSVLVPVDFSAWSPASVVLAQAIAPEAELVLMHAYEVPFEGKMRIAGVDEDTVRAHRQAARKESVDRLGRLAAEAGLDESIWRAVVAHGDAAARILEQEEVQGADLVVLGKHGTGVAEELLLGSVTKHVLSQARCDVLVASR